MVVFLL